MAKCYVVKGFDIKEKKIEIVDIPEINGQRNSECRGGLIYEQETEKTFIRIGLIGPKGYLAPHKAAGSTCTLLTNGYGIIGIVTKEGKTIAELNVQAGDRIIFETPMELHDYSAGAEGMEYYVIGL